MHTSSLLSSIHASIHPSFAPPAGISLKNLNTKKSCQAYFLVIVQPSLFLHPPLPSSPSCDSHTFPLLPEIKRTLVAPQAVCVCVFELWGPKRDMREVHAYVCLAPTLIIFKALTSLVCDITSHQHPPTPTPFSPLSPPLLLLPWIYLSIRLSPSLTSFRERLTERGKQREERKETQGVRMIKKNGGGETATANKLGKTHGFDEEKREQEIH